MKTQLKPLNEQVIVITGATSGIGLTTARAAVARGARVVLVARTEDALRQVAAELERQGGQVAWVIADVADRAALDHVVQVATERFGRIDTWVNDAGVGAYAKIEDITEADHRRIFETNYWGVVNGSLAAVGHFRRRGGSGALINVGSISSDMPAPVLSTYTATKHAVKGFTNSLRLELMHDRAPISVTLIKPSGISTPFGDHAKNYLENASRVPPPVYDPKLVADAILHAAETPTRELVVGGVGRVMTAFARLAPGLADRIYADAFYKTAVQTGKPAQPGDALHEGASEGRARGDETFVFKRSLYTSAVMHPGRWAAGAVAVGALAALVAAGRTRRGVGMRARRRAASPEHART